MKRNQKRLKLVAYHEAGHAVVSHYFEKGIRRVTIKPNPDDGTAGHVLKYFSRVKHDSSAYIDNPRLRESLEHRMLISYGGEAATYILSGRRDAVGAGRGNPRNPQGDSKAVNKVISFLYGGHYAPPGTRSGERLEKEISAYCEWLWWRAVNLLSLTQNWRSVRLVAAELLKRETITGRECSEVIQRGYRDLIKSLPQAPEVIIQRKI